MSRTFDGVDDVLTAATENEWSSASVISVVACVNPSSVAGFHTIACKRSSGTNCTWQLRVGQASGDGLLAFTWSAGGTFQNYAGGAAPPAISTGVWTNVGVFFDWTDPANIVYWINGTNYPRTRSSGSGSSPDDSNVPVTIGRRNDDAHEFAGDIAEVAIWNIQVPDTMMEAITGGKMSPLVWRGQRNLTHYWPLVGNTSPEIELVAGNGLTVTGATKGIDHPRVFDPGPKRVGKLAAPAIVTSPWFFTQQILRARRAG